MSPNAITIELPHLSGFDAHEAANRVALLDTYTQLIKARMGLAPCDALQPAALLAATHGLNNELGGIIASMAQPASAETVGGADVASICKAIDTAAYQIADALRDVGLDTEKALEALADKVGKLGEAIKGVDTAIEFAEMGIKSSADAISASLDHIARDLRDATAEAIYTRVDEVLKQQRMATQTAPRRVTKARCK